MLKVLQEAVACMCIVVQNLTHDFVRLVNLMKSCNGSFFPLKTFHFDVLLDYPRSRSASNPTTQIQKYGAEWRTGLAISRFHCSVTCRTLRLRPDPKRERKWVFRLKRAISLIYANYGQLCLLRSTLYHGYVDTNVESTLMTDDFIEFYHRTYI